MGQAASERAEQLEKALDIRVTVVMAGRDIPATGDEFTKNVLETVKPSAELTAMCEGNFKG